MPLAYSGKGPGQPWQQGHEHKGATVSARLFFSNCASCIQSSENLSGFVKNTPKEVRESVAKAVFLEKRRIDMTLGQRASSPP
ncbi:hypothetical protein NDU88_000805 [Pleurodeles waltl]|uniref:Uncharacterized protein n=1 Tax=Pleurodeles waltl TaxID=8319 RepID=A0AAV7L967_PLEWA|nr:hypothetical protein NDU88_000805 [Pleurodeles waltl]